jgi:hypothetical protein
MPSLESNLLYTTAHQTNPQRAGTPGRALRNRRAVVEIRRPLCLFIALMALAAPVHAQQGFSSKPSIQIRLGAFMATPLVNDAVSSRALDDSIPGLRSNEITIAQKPGPIGTIALRVPLRGATHLEVAASAGSSTLRGDDGRQSWDVDKALIGNFTLGFGYLYHQKIGVHAGVGVTKIFVEDTGLFSKGNSMRPVLEAGISSGVNVGGRSVDLDFRAQTHSFGTATLRDNGGSDGNVLRFMLQLGTTLWGGR